MTRSLGRRSGAAVVLVGALLAVVPASPAGATPAITFNEPRSGQVAETATVTVSGEVGNTSALHSVKTVVVSVGDKKSPTVNCTETPCRFSWKVTLPLNGPYTAKVNATEALIALGSPGTPGEATRAFKVAAPPARPVLDRPTVDEGRNVDLTWSRNTEPDMLYYAVFRRDPSGGDFRQVGGKIAQPPSGAKVAFSDTTTSAFTGGDYSYRVVAVRKGASGTGDTETTSEPSAAGAAAVPPPPTTSTSAPLPPGAPVPPGAGATTTTAKPGPPAGVDLSGFLSSRSQPTPVAPITVPEPPDTGFTGTLPFGARPGDDVEEGEAEAVPPRDAGVGRRSVFTTIDSGRPLVPVAGGLVLLLLALHMRLLNRRIKEVPAGDLPVDAGPPPPAPLVAAAPPPPAETPAPAATAFYDVAEDETWEEDWAPAAKPEPELTTAVWADLDELEGDELDQVEDDELDQVEDDELDEIVEVEVDEVEDEVDEVEDEVDEIDEIDEIEIDEIEIDEIEVEDEVDEIEIEIEIDEIEFDDDVPAAADLVDFEQFDGSDEIAGLDEPEEIEEIEVVEVVSPTRRPLARAGSR